VDNGADAVYMGLRDDTNARHFPGLNFDEKRARQGIDYARARGSKVLLAINTYLQPVGWKRWVRTADRAADPGVDGLILAGIGVMDYAKGRWLELPLLGYALN